MTAREFCYWLQGKLEIDGQPEALSTRQVAVIQKHLAMVFLHDIDPTAGPKETQDDLNYLHHGSALPRVQISRG